ncbi:MAG: hypothetical protein ACYCYK_11005 [Candidatus Dormibacteria bacterium]
MIQTLALIGCGLAAALVCGFGPRSRWVQGPAALLFLGSGCLLSAHLLAIRSPLTSHWVDGVGTLQPTRVAAGLLLGGAAAMILEAAVAGAAGPSPRAQALLLALLVPAAVAVATNSLAVAAFAASALMGVVWLRWQRVAGPQLSVRSVARQSVLVFSALLGAAAILPGVRLGSSPPILAAILIALATAGLMGVMPFSGWVGSATRLGRSEAVFWRLLLLPAGALLEARAIALSPATVATPLRELLIGLGLATALYWGARALLGPDQGRYPRALASDSGLICIGIAFGTVEGLAAALILIVTHWLGGAVLADENSPRAQLLAWVGMSGIPPFGGFTGRLLTVLAAVSFSPLLAALLLLGGGCQLGSAAAGMRSTLTPVQTHVGRFAEVLGLGLALLTLVLGLVPAQAIHLLFGFRP